MRRIPHKSLEDISSEWDVIADKRQHIIEQGKDLSLLYVTAPCILRNVELLNAKRVIDVGRGSGYLTHKISKLVDNCWGIDSSVASIQLAQKKYSSDNMHFFVSTISNYKFPSNIDVCTANMVFMDDPEWRQSILHIYHELLPGGSFLFTITHPCFWPQYWGYDKEPWFDYFKEIYIEADFNITTEKKLGISTHIHRPLSQYMNDLLSVGFSIVNIEEPLPILDLPMNYEKRYPRFLFFHCKKRYD